MEHQHYFLIQQDHSNQIDLNFVLRIKNQDVKTVLKFKANNCPSFRALNSLTIFHHRPVPWSSLVEGVEGCNGPSGKLLRLCQKNQNYAAHAWQHSTFAYFWADQFVHLLLLKISMDVHNTAVTTTITPRTTTTTTGKNDTDIYL